MPLVDIRDRDADDRLGAPSAPLRWGDASTPGGLVGWEEDGTLLAWVTLERTAPDEVILHALAATSDETGRRLVEEIAVSVGDATLVARCTAGPEAFGFRRVGAAWQLRPAPPVPGGEEQVGVVDPVGMGLADLAARVRAAWDRETSADPDEWAPDNPARGQCDVTAALVQELAGGSVLVAGVIRDGRRVERHAWNRLPDGTAVDLTREQFPPGTLLEAPRDDGLALLGDFERRLALLRDRTNGVTAAPA